MHCPHCEREIPDGVTLCPQCGAMVEETQPSTPARSGPNRQSERASAGASSSRLRQILYWGLAFVVLLALSVALGAYFGVGAGEEERVRRLEQEVESHYQTGLERLDEGNYQVAKAQFEYVLQLDAEHVGARQGLVEAEAQLTIEPTPIVDPGDSVMDELYAEARSHYEADDWQEAAAVLTSMRQIDPDYMSDDVEEMLFQSRYRAGMTLLEQEEFELGIFYLDRAVALRPLDEEATTERRLARQYLDALNYWGVDWEECIARFEELYETAPGYNDVFQRLHGAHIGYAEAWESRREMCPAVEQYDEALRLLDSDAVKRSLADAAEVCRNATPTPVPTIEGMRPITTTTLPPGFNAGRLAYPVYDSALGEWQVFALFADGRLLQVASGADQPAWMWNGGALAYRNRVSLGLSFVSSLEAAPQRLASGSGLAWPTFAPDGNRVAYAERDETGQWQIIVAAIDGSGERRRHASGWGPAWGPNGLLAWTGCEPDDPEACGIFIDNPDDDQPGTRVSGSENDIGLSWSPDGNRLAYMSNHTGNWQIYLYNLEGGFEVLTDDSALDGLPAWAPDGSAIAFVSNRDGAWGIYLMSPAGEDPRQVISLGPNLPNWTQQRLSWGP